MLLPSSANVRGRFAVQRGFLGSRVSPGATLGTDRSWWCPDGGDCGRMSWLASWPGMRPIRTWSRRALAGPGARYPRQVMRDRTGRDRALSVEWCQRRAPRFTSACSAAAESSTRVLRPAGGRQLSSPASAAVPWINPARWAPVRRRRRDRRRSCPERRNLDGVRARPRRLCSRLTATQSLQWTHKLRTVAVLATGAPHPVPTSTTNRAGVLQRRPSGACRKQPIGSAGYRTATGQPGGQPTSCLLLKSCRGAIDAGRAGHA